MEVTTIFLYSLQPHLLQPAALMKNAQLFSARMSGDSVGPTVHESVEMFDTKATMSKDVLFAHNSVTPAVGPDSEVSSIVDSTKVEASVEGTAEHVDVTVETVLSSLVDTVVVNAASAGTGDISGSANFSAVPNSKSEKPRLPLVVPSELTLLLCPTVRVECVFLIVIVSTFLCVLLANSPSFSWKFSPKHYS